jgi:hypothetical protein
MFRAHRGKSAAHLFRAHKARHVAAFRAHGKRKLRGRRVRGTAPARAAKLKITPYHSLLPKVPAGYKPHSRPPKYKPVRPPPPVILAAALKQARVAARRP